MTVINQITSFKKRIRIKIEIINRSRSQYWDIIKITSYCDKHWQLVRCEYKKNAALDNDSSLGVNDNFCSLIIFHSDNKKFNNVSFRVYAWKYLVIRPISLTVLSKWHDKRWEIKLNLSKLRQNYIIKNLR